MMPVELASDRRPGMAASRLARLVREAVERCQLDLNDVEVLTEAASGPYVVTPVIAALAGARVTAIAAESRYGSVKQIVAATMDLASSLKVADRITVTDHRTPELFAEADVVTNSGFVRPITGEFARAVRSSAVLPLMFESWEIQSGRLDLDLGSLLARGVQIAGTNERHPNVDVFSYLGSMAVAQLADAGVSAYRGRVTLLCDNPFHDYLIDGLKGAGADVRAADTLADLRDDPQPDALIVALTPRVESPWSADDLAKLTRSWPDTVVVQFWGDIDRALCDAAGLSYWPAADPGQGHMGVLPSRVGPEPIVRLQTGGLKVAQVLRIPAAARTSDDLAYLDPLTEEHQVWTAP
ncbi:MAG TPA: hypothetical protein VGL39_19085 [Jatrophihabitantaceae bacterium]|jgi:hypothetical protein